MIIDSLSGLFIYETEGEAYAPPPHALSINLVLLLRQAALVSDADHGLAVLELQSPER